MSRLIITRGLPASGKTTAARAWVAEDPATRARVNRDDLRAMLHGGRLGTEAQESQVSIAQQEAVAGFLRAGYDVVCDDTNLHPEHLDVLRNDALHESHDVEVWDFTHVPLDECIARDAQRKGAARVGEDVIRDMWRGHLAPESSGPEVVE